MLEDSAEDLYEHAPCGYLSCYPDGLIARVNQTFLTWTGYTRDELLGGRRFVDLLTAGGRIYHETHYAPLLRMQGSVRAIAVELSRADGTRMPVLVNSDLRLDGDGEPLAVRTTVFDATDRKQYETELLAAAGPRLRSPGCRSSTGSSPTSPPVRRRDGQRGDRRCGHHRLRRCGSAVWLVDERPGPTCPPPSRAGGTRDLPADAVAHLRLALACGRGTGGVARHECPGCAPARESPVRSSSRR